MTWRIDIDLPEVVVEDPPAFVPYEVVRDPNESPVVLDAFVTSDGQSFLVRQ